MLFVWDGTDTPPASLESEYVFFSIHYFAFLVHDLKLQMKMNEFVTTMELLLYYVGC